MRGRITYKDDLEQHLLVDLHELLIPVVDVGDLLPGIVLLLVGLHGVVAVVLAPLDHLAKDGLVDLVGIALAWTQ